MASRRLRPDLAVLLAGRSRVPVTESPDLAVEIVSPSELARDVALKVATYLEARHVYVHATDGVLHFRAGDALTCRVIPEWRPR